VDTFGGDLKLARLGDLDRLDGLVAGLGLGVLNLLDELVALKDLAEDDVAAIEPTAREKISVVFRGVSSSESWWVFTR
jgi:hypothetical protein